MEKLYAFTNSNPGDVLPSSQGSAYMPLVLVLCIAALLIAVLAMFNGSGEVTINSSAYDDTQVRLSITNLRGTMTTNFGRVQTSFSSVHNTLSSLNLKLASLTADTGVLGYRMNETLAYLSKVNEIVDVVYWDSISNQFSKALTPQSVSLRYAVPSVPLSLHRTGLPQAAALDNVQGMFENQVRPQFEVRLQQGPAFGQIDI